jgi:hypothetical protein
MSTSPEQDGLNGTDFPNLAHASSGYRRTSNRTTSYNCIAWAAGVDTEVWWPELRGTWPTGAPREATVNAFIKAFETRAYFQCTDAGFERDFEKVAIFALNGKPKHACYQLPNGLWTSKMGKNVDCVHALEAICGPCYGQVAVILKRKVSWKGRNHPALQF